MLGVFGFGDGEVFRGLEGLGFRFMGQLGGIGGIFFMKNRSLYAIQGVFSVCALFWGY